jgi:hypothetical protein
MFPEKMDGLKPLGFVSSGRFSFFHFVIPPFNIDTFSCEKYINIQTPLAASIPETVS